MPDRVWKGAAALEQHLVPIGELERAARNPRRGHREEIAKSLDRFGQVRAILASDREIVAGNHTYLAALDLGWTHIAVVRHSFADHAEARAYLLTDNRLADLGEYEERQLLVMLEELEDGDGWEGTGYTPDDLDDLRALHDQVPTTEPEPFAGGYAADAAELAARAEQLAAGRAMKELVLILTRDQREAFDTHVQIIRKEYGGLGGVTETVFRAVAGQALRVNQ